MSPSIKKRTFIAVLFVVHLSTVAQDSTTPPPPQRTPPVGLPLPIDENIVILIAAGLVLGGYFFFRKKFSKTAG